VQTIFLGNVERKGVRWLVGYCIGYYTIWLAFVKRDFVPSKGFGLAMTLSTPAGATWHPALVTPGSRYTIIWTYVVQPAQLFRRWWRVHYWCSKGIGWHAPPELALDTQYVRTLMYVFTEGAQLIGWRGVCTQAHEV
jgi:hypothetical protein